MLMTFLLVDFYFVVDNDDGDDRVVITAMIKAIQQIPTGDNSTEWEWS